MSASKNSMHKQLSFAGDSSQTTSQQQFITDHHHHHQNQYHHSSSNKLKQHLHSLYDLIDKEIDSLINENLLLKERVETLEDLIENSGHGYSAGTGGGTIQTSDSFNIKNLPPIQQQQQQQQQKSQQFSVSSVKRDSMVAASQLSQKIKSTYKLKTSSKIFKGQSNSSSHLIGTYEWHKDGIWYITSSQKNGTRQYIATASADSTVNICDVTKIDYNLQPIAIYNGHQSSVNCVKFHSNNDLMLTASGDGTAQIWRFNPDSLPGGGYDNETTTTTTGQDFEPFVIKSSLLELSDHHNVVVSCDWMCGVDQCVTASWDHMANIYDYHTGELVVQLVGHDQALTDVCAHESTRLIVTSSHDTTFRLWDFRDAIHSVSVFQGHSRSVTSTCFLGSDKIISGGDDRNVKVWDLKNMRSPLMTISMESGINKLSVSKQYNLITIPLDNRNVRIYDINGNRICRLSRNSHNRMVTCATWLQPSSSILDNSMNSGQTSSTTGQASIINTASSSSNTNTSSSNAINNTSSSGGGLGGGSGSGSGSGVPNQSNQSSNSLTLFTCAFDRRVCAWNIVIEK